MYAGISMSLFPAPIGGRAEADGQPYPIANLTPMHTRIARVTHSPRESALNILYSCSLDAHYMLWLAPLTTEYEFTSTTTSSLRGAANGPFSSSNQRLQARRGWPK